MTQFKANRVMRRYFENTVQALIPQIWAKYGLAVLEANMVASQLVYRDFEQTFAAFGDTVNTRKPRTFTAKRKTDADSVTVQDAILDNIAVKLDQHIHVSFLIKDGQETLAMDDLVRTFLEPAMAAQAQMADEIVLGQYVQFLKKSGQAGTLGGLTSSNGKAYMLELDQRMNEGKVPVQDRSLIVSPNMKNILMQNANWTDAEKRGDEGTALRDASLGRNLGFNTFMCQNMPSVLNASDTPPCTGFVINNGNIAKGSTVLTVGSGSGTIVVGMWFTLDGKVYQVKATNGTTSITIDAPGLWAATVNAHALSFGAVGTVNLSGGYPAGWGADITVSGFTIAPQRGQIVTFNTDVTNSYTVIGQPTATAISLDRPLVAAISNSDKVNLGPSTGDFGLALSRNALALVCRPLSLPRVGTLSGAASHNGFSMRCVMTYDGRAQGHLVTLDMLLGIAVFENYFGAVLLG